MPALQRVMQRVFSPANYIGIFQRMADVPWDEAPEGRQIVVPVDLSRR